ncbi:hypothetical protein AB1Y20_023404 [Prymnesium parvum]|uniref:Plant heme peroxidase family profile domain-containing protein n=1 Tax=Prymnesium parvum TaxID=97485 RepID=A0AB34JD47_PRYPA
MAPSKLDQQAAGEDTDSAAYVKLEAQDRPPADPTDDSRRPLAPPSSRLAPLALLAAVATVAAFSLPPRAAAPAALPPLGLAAVDWPALRADLTQFVHACDCGPILVRLSWHDAGTFNASDGTGGSHAEMRFPDGEATDPANAGLAVARGLLAPFKARFPAVGYADLWALAATVAVEAMGGPRVAFRAGRRDGEEVEGVDHGRLPDGSLYAAHLRAVFYRMGLDDREIVALSGAHTVGRCHADRSGFEGPWTNEPLRFNSDYFVLLLGCDWQPYVVMSTGNAQLACEAAPGLMMLHTDKALVTDASFRPHVVAFAENQSEFFEAFAAAFQKLQELGHKDLEEVF